MTSSRKQSTEVKKEKINDLLIKQDCEGIISNLLLNNNIAKTSQIFHIPEEIEKCEPTNLDGLGYQKGMVKRMLTNFLNELKNNNREHASHYTQNIYHRKDSVEKELEIIKNSSIRKPTRNLTYDYHSFQVGSLDKFMKTDQKDKLNLNSVNSAEISSNNNSSFRERNSTRKFIAFQTEKERKIIRKKKIHDSFSIDENEAIDQNLKNSLFVITHDSIFLFYWNIVLLGMTIYSLVYFPLSISFNSFNSQSVIIFNVIIDLIFLIDVVLNFFIASQSIEEDKIYNHKKIIKEYFSTWFFLDFLTGIPFNIIFYFMIESEIIELFKILKIFKILKVSSQNSEMIIGKFPFIYELTIYSSKKRLGNFFIYFSIISHTLTSLWIYVANQNNSNWMTNIKINYESQDEIYTSSLYFIWTTIFTIGYGDVIPTNSIERIFSIFLLSFGIAVYSFAVTSMSTIILQMHSKKERLIKNLDMVENLSDLFNIDENLKKRLKRFFTYEDKNNNISIYPFIKELPTKSKNLLLMNMYHQILIHSSFFKYSQVFRNDDFNTKIFLSFSPQILLKGENIIDQDEIVKEMFFVKKGELISLFDNQLIFRLKNFDYFGDVLCLSNTPSPVSITVKSKSCELFLIKKEDLVEIWKDYQLIFDKIFQISSFKYLQIISSIQKIQKKFRKSMKSPKKK